MILVDLHCPNCGTAVEDFALEMGGDVDDCPGCRQPMRVTCNGGTKLRARVHDFPELHDPWWDGQASTHSAEVVDADDNPIVDQRPGKGGPITLNQERSQLRRDKAKSERKRKFGQTPITVDLASK